MGHHRALFCVAAILFSTAGPPPAAAQHTICCNLLINVNGDWFGAIRPCTLGAAPPERLANACQQLIGCTEAAAFCGVPKPCTVEGSVVDVPNQALGESVPVAGTPFALHYRSDRVSDQFANSFGGWSFGVHHAYGVKTRLFHDGDGTRRVVRVDPPAKAVEVAVPSTDGRLAHAFTVEGGRHLRTLDAVTGAVVHRFGYDKDGRLLSIEDASANRTRIERDAKGAPTAIVAPGGERTTVTVDADGRLQSLTGPRGDKTTLAYDAGGRLTLLTDPRAQAHRFAYSAGGALVKDENPAGGSWTLARAKAAEGSRVTLTSALGRSSSHTSDRLPSGQEKLLHRRPDGTVSRMERAPDGSRRTVHADGSVETVTVQPDPRFGDSAPIARTVRFETPGGRKLAATLARESDSGRPGGDSSETLTVNGASRVTRYSEERQEWTRATPAGRTLTLAVDDQGRVTSARAAGRHPVQVAYDDAGRIARITAGSGPDARAIVVTHGETDVTITDAAKRATRLELDAMGRLVRRTAPGGAETRLVRDAKGNIEQVVVPGGATHRFEYSPADRPIAYLPPGAPPERYAYDRDGRLTTVTVGGTKAVGIEYDAAGRRSVLTTPHATLRYQYDAASGHLRTVTAADGAALALDHDGPLLTGMAWSGPVRGRVARAYDDHLRLSSVGVDGGGSYAIGYDADGLAVRAGDLAVERDPATGAVSATAMGVVTTREVRNPFGEVTRIEAAAAGRPLLAIAYERDGGGRIVSRTETTPAGRRVTRYAYDAAGRLGEVRAEGTPAVAFAYDADGNRTAPVGSARKYTALDHDALGALRRATLADGRVVEYLLDGAHRRIGKRVAGGVAEGLLYRDALRPAAQVDGAGKVRALFVHATRVNVPDAMIAGGVAYRIVTDHLGSPRLVVEAATGKVVQEMEHDAFGNVARDTSPGFQPFGFAGGLLDRDTGLVHFGARDYDPALGRWTSRDPLGFAAGTTSLHEYAANDPVNRSDPRGLQDEPLVDEFGIFDDPSWSDPSQTTIVEIDTAGNVHVVSPPDQPGPMDVPVDGGPAPGPSRLDKVIDLFRNGAPFLGGTTKLGQPRDRHDRGDTAPGMYCDPWTGETRPQNATDLPGTPATGGVTTRWVF